MVHELNGFSITEELVQDMKDMHDLDILGIIRSKDYSSKKWVTGGSEFILDFDISVTPNKFSISRKLIPDKLESWDIVAVKLRTLINGFTSTINGKASFGTLIKAFNDVDPEFNHAFSAGYGAKFDSNGQLIDVDGFGLFKQLKYETHPILSIGDKNYILELEGDLMNDVYNIKIARTDFKTVGDIIWNQDSKYYKRINK